MRFDIEMFNELQTGGVNTNGLYRYISFESFVGLIQEQALTFVLPEVWDDPKENAAFLELVKNEESEYAKIAHLIIRDKTYCQCWSLLSESDAMWRIYSYNNRAVQIRTSHEKIKLLNDIDIVTVTYSDNLNLDNYGNKKDAFLKALGIKRTAFEHEKEVRLINHYRFKDDADFEKQVKAFLAVHKHPQMVRIFESLNSGEPLEETIENCIELLNLGTLKKPVKKISFKHIPNFIEGVKVHPLAPDWYVDVVKEYCSRNNISFDGKSKLYSAE